MEVDTIVQWSSKSPLFWYIRNKKYAFEYLTVIGLYDIFMVVFFKYLYKTVNP